MWREMSVKEEGVRECVCVVDVVDDDDGVEEEGAEEEAPAEKEVGEEGVSAPLLLLAVVGVVMADVVC